MAATPLLELRGIDKSFGPVQVLHDVGLSVYPDHGEDAATLVRNADLAMYYAKGRGKNGWQTYGPEIGAHARSAVGLYELPFNIPVEIEGEVELKA